MLKKYQNSCKKEVYIVVSALAGIGLGHLIGYLLGRRGFGALLALRDATKNEVDRLSKEQKVKVAEAQELGRENVSLKARNDALALQVGQLRSQMAYEECKAAQRLQEQKEQSQAEHERQRKQMHEQLVSERHNAQELIDATYARLEAERKLFADLMDQSQKQWAERHEAMRAEVASQNAERLTAREEALQQSNKVQMDELLRPIREQFADFKRLAGCLLRTRSSPSC